MSRPERRKELAAQREAQWVIDEQERRRIAALPLYERIEESDASADVKDILHRLAQGERE